MNDPQEIVADHRSVLNRGSGAEEGTQTLIYLMMHNVPQFLPDPDAIQFREMCWGCGSARAVVVVEKGDETQVIGGLWCWLCSRAIHQDCIGAENPATVGCRNLDCPLFPPD